MNERPDWCWAAHPRPLPGEVFSSWLLRTARANRIKPTGFVALTLGNKTLLRGDMDRRLKPEVLRRLAERTVQAPATLVATTLSTLEGPLTRRLAPTSNTRWVLPFGLWGRGRRVSGIPFCPHCLSTGEPYYRLRWRCSFAPACSTHGTLLHGGCPHCLAPAVFHRLEFGPGVKNALARTPITTCWRCQGDLREVEGCEPASILTLWTQSLFDDALTRGRVSLGDLSVPAIAFAEVAYELLGLLSRGPQTAGFRTRVAEAAGVEPVLPEPGHRSRLLEALPVQDRARVLAMLGWLLEDWPGRLVDAAQGAWMSRSQFTRHLDPATVPGWYRAALEPLTTGHGRPRGQKRRTVEGTVHTAQAT